MSEINEESSVIDQIKNNSSHLNKEMKNKINLDQIEDDESSVVDIEEIKKIFQCIQPEYEQIRNKMYKEMEIEMVQNNIYMKLYGKKKTNEFVFNRVNDPNEFFVRHSNKSNIQEIDKKDESDIEDESDIVDFDNIEDDEEGDNEVFKNKYLDLEADEGSSIDEIEGFNDNFDYKKSISNQQEMIKRLEMKYLRKKNYRKTEKIEIEDISNSSDDEFDLNNSSNGMDNYGIEKDEESLECVETEIRKDFI